MFQIDDWAAQFDALTNGWGFAIVSLVMVSIAVIAYVPVRRMRSSKAEQRKRKS